MNTNNLLFVIIILLVVQCFFNYLALCKTDQMLQIELRVEKKLDLQMAEVGAMTEATKKLNSQIDEADKLLADAQSSFEKSKRQ